MKKMIQEIFLLYNLQERVFVMDQPQELLFQKDNKE